MARQQHKLQPLPAPTGKIRKLPPEVAALIPPTTPNNIRRSKIDIEHALKMRLINRNTFQEIADYYGVAKPTVHEALKPYLGTGDVDVHAFKANRADILAIHQQRVLSALTTDDIEKASARDKAIVFGTLYDKERLERGQSTSNQSVFFQLVGDSDQVAE